MDRNLLLAIVLSIAIILLFQVLFRPSARKPSEKKPPAVTEQPAKEPAKRTTAAPVETPSPEAGPVQDRPLMLQPAGEMAGDAAPDTRIKIDTLKYEVILSSHGARIVSFKLKDYREQVDGPALVNLFKAAPEDSSGPAVELFSQGKTLSDAALPYKCESGETTVSLHEKGAKKTIRFTTNAAGGIAIVKTYTFHADLYYVDLDVSLTNSSAEDQYYLVYFPWMKAYGRANKSEQFPWNSVEIYMDNLLVDTALTKIDQAQDKAGQVQWAGLGDSFFFQALVFGDKPAKKVTLYKPRENGLAKIRVYCGALDIAAGKSEQVKLGIYLGPKEHAALEAAGHDLSRALYYSNWRIMDVVSDYLMVFLRACHYGFSAFGLKIPGTGNWGLDIIILTIVIKILFIPLTHKSMKSMKRMQELQPQLEKLREKFKEDKAALNKATMELFREHKVNPLGGCWPIFLQLPVFIALYQTLAYAIELRHASFVCIPSIYFCINDLSAKDPFYVTPVLMGASMVLQQWMTPSAGDPTQRKMMLIMPVVFTFLFLKFPSGLVLYWLVSNILSIGQQVVTNRLAK